MLPLACSLLVCSQQAAPATPELPSAVVLEAHALIVDLALDPAGGTVFTLVKEGQVQAWQRGAAKELWKSTQPEARVLRCVERGLVLALRTPAAATLDPRTGAALPAWKGGGEGELTGFAVDRAGRRAWCSTAAGVLRLAEGEEGRWHQLRLDSGVRALALDEKETTLALGLEDGSVRLAAADTLELDYKKVLRGPASPVAALAFGPKLVVGAFQDGSLRLWNALSGQPRASLSQSGAAVRVLAVAPRSGWFASGDDDGNVLLWQLGSGTVRAHWKVDRVLTPIAALAFAPDEKSLLAAAGTRVLALDLGTPGAAPK